MTGFAILTTCVFVGRGSGLSHAVGTRKRPLAITAGGSKLSLLILTLALVCYTALVMVWEDFTYYDHSHFTNETLVGRDTPVEISPAVGRFWPLGYQEFNVLRHFTRSVYGYHSVRIVQLLAVCGILLALESELSLRARVALIIVLISLPSMLVSFSGLIYPEANVVLWFAAVVFCTKRFEVSRQLGWTAAAVLAAQLLLYYKETGFLLLLGFTAGRLFLRCWLPGTGRLNFERLKNAESRLDCCLAFSILPFLIYYAAASFPFTRQSYAANNRVPFQQAVVAYFAIDLVAWIFLCVVVFRFVCYVQGKLMPSLLWDGMALGGALYFLSYLFLRIESAYFLAPVDFAAILYLGSKGVRCRGNWSRWTRFLIYGLASAVIVQAGLLSAFRMYERKNVIHANVVLADAILDRYNNNSEKAMRLFFPHAGPSSILEFASYLNYRGVAIEQFVHGAEKGRSVRLIGMKVEKDGPCDYRTFICHPGTAPASGDLVIELPDDSSSLNEMRAYQRSSSEVLIAYTPHPSIPGWMEPLVKHLHVVSPGFAFSPLPDSWLSAAVIVSK